jgi:hypothetical protein
MRGGDSVIALRIPATDDPAFPWWFSVLNLQMTRLEEDATRLQPRLTAQLAELNAEVQAEGETRQAADAGNLRVIATAMERLQREALLTFGTEDVVHAHRAAHGDDEGEGEG